MDTVKLNINLTVEQLIEAVKQLSPIDRLKINDAIWNEDTDIPYQHKEIVLNRIAKSTASPNRMLDWDEVLKTL